MGARAPLSIRPRRGAFKCEFCGRHLMSLEKLRSHQRVLHASALKQRDQRRITLKQSKTAVKKRILPTKGVKLPSKSVKVSAKAPKVITTRAKFSPAKKVLLQNKVLSPKMEVESVKASEDSKTEFQCPQCERMYPSLFSAQRHIQKYHRVDSKGDKIPLTDLVKPTVIEYCKTCNTKYSVNHVCPDSSPPPMMLECSGCKQQFNSTKLFDVHVTGLHGDGLENMFFPSNKEFLNWKEQMETQTKTKYLIMGKTDSKQIYRCCNIENNDDDPNTLLCPSTIIFQEFAKGAQVNFYINHYGHTFEKYILKDKYKTYCITNMLQQASSYTAMTSVNSDDTDLYLQFKTLMESIVLDAAKLNIDSLKILIGKALDMTSVLTEYDEDAESVVTNVSSTLSLNKKPDDQIINQTLEGLRSSLRIKRKSSVVVMDVPQKVLRKMPTPILDKSPILQKIKVKSTFSLANDKDSIKILKELDSDNKKVVDKKPTQTKDGIENVTQNSGLESPKIVPKTVTFESPSSFNDSYKDFIDKTLKTPAGKKANDQKTSKQTPDTKKKIVKTKMGQFKPNTSPKPMPSIATPKTPTLNIATPKTPTPSIATPKKPTPSIAISKKPTPSIATPKKPMPSIATPKKPMPSIATPNKPTPSIATPKLRKSGRISLDTVKDIEYEVKEQENDCNILILKI